MAAIVVWSYYAFVIHLCVLTVVVVDGYAIMFLLLIPYHILLTLFVWSYWKTVFSRYVHYLHINTTYINNVPKILGYFSKLTLKMDHV